LKRRKKKDRREKSITLIFSTQVEKLQNEAKIVAVQRGGGGEGREIKKKK